MKKFVHLKSFPLSYEIDSEGHCRKRTREGFIHFKRYHEETGVWVDISVDGKIHKCFLAELLLLSYIPTFNPGFGIQYKDGDIHNVNMKNIRARKITDNPAAKHKSLDDGLAGLWRCESRANNANRRYLAVNQFITKHEVLRCLMVCDFRCFYCGDKLNPYTWNLDHHLPSAKGGKNIFDNLRPCCKECNQMKSDLVYGEFVKRAHRIVLMYMKHNPDHTFSHMNYTTVEKYAKAV